MAVDADIPHTELAKTDADYDSAERGRYLAKTACLYCHTEELSSGVPDMTKAFAGGKIYTFVRGSAANTSTNLTPDATGLKTWSAADIVAAIKGNKDKDTGMPCSLSTASPGVASRKFARKLPPNSKFSGRRRGQPVLQQGHGNASLRRAHAIGRWGPTPRANRDDPELDRCGRQG